MRGRRASGDGLGTRTDDRSRPHDGGEGLGSWPGRPQGIIRCLGQAWKASVACSREGKRRRAMSNYDQNLTISEADALAIDGERRSYMLRIYNYMAAGVGLTAVVAWITYQLTGPELLNNPVMWVFVLAPLVLVFVISARINTLSVATARWLFFIYAALVGVSLSTLFHIYTNSSITRVFFITAAMFGALSLFGQTTRRDLSGM